MMHKKDWSLRVLAFTLKLQMEKSMTIESKYPLLTEIIKEFYHGE